MRKKTIRLTGGRADGSEVDVELWSIADANALMKTLVWYNIELLTPVVLRATNLR